MDLSELRDRLRRFAADREWDQFHSPKNLAMALSVEVAELVEHFQWLSDAESRDLPQVTKNDVAQEAADVQIYLVRLAHKLGIDLLEAAKAKIEENENRYPAEQIKGSAPRHRRHHEAESHG